MTMKSRNQNKSSANNNQAVDVSEWEIVESIKPYLFTEAAMKIKEEELNSTISKLENKISSLKESLANEESQKLNAIDFLNKEKEARMALEKNHDSLKEELLQAKQNASTAEEEVKTQQDMNKILQEYNRSLQQYNTQLQNQLFTAIDANKHFVKEKAAILENHITLKEHYNFLQQCCSQTEKISVLEHQLAAANEKLKMVDLSSLEIRRKYEDQKRIVSKLEDQLLEAGLLFEEERLRAQGLYKLM
ncbi:hypothetical protein Lser_V15G32130 [Lactuca serriola]